MQQDAVDPLPVCDSEGHLLFCSLQSGGGEGRGQHQCQKDQQNNPQGWNHHCPESECGVREKQEVTEKKMQTTHVTCSIPHYRGSKAPSPSDLVNPAATENASGYQFYHSP